MNITGSLIAASHNKYFETIFVHLASGTNIWYMETTGDTLYSMLKIYLLTEKIQKWDDIYNAHATPMNDNVYMLLVTGE